MCTFIKYNRNKKSISLHTDIYANHMLNVIAFNANRIDSQEGDLKAGQCKIKADTFGMDVGVYRATKKRLERLGLVAFTPSKKYTIATLLSSEVYDINLGGNNIPNNIPNDTQPDLYDIDDTEVIGLKIPMNDIPNNIPNDTQKENDIPNDIVNNIPNDTQPDLGKSDQDETTEGKKTLNDIQNDIVNNIVNDTLDNKNNIRTFKKKISIESPSEKKEDLKDIFNHIYQPQDLGYFTMTDGLAKLELYFSDSTRSEQFFQVNLRRVAPDELREVMISFVQNRLDTSSRYYKRIETFPSLISWFGKWFKHHRFEQKKVKDIEYYQENAQKLQALQDSFVEVMREKGKSAKVEAFAEKSIKFHLNNIAASIRKITTSKKFKKLSGLTDQEVIKLAFMFRGQQKSTLLLEIVTAIEEKDFLRNGKHSIFDAILAQYEYLKQRSNG